MTVVRDIAPARPLREEDLVRHLAREVFPSPAVPGTARRIGAEVEVIPVELATGRPLPLAGRGSTLEMLRRAGARHGWIERRSLKAPVPEIALPDGGRITFEPGGQIEISSAPSASLSTLVTGLETTVGQIADAAPDGVTLLSCGIDPVNAVGDIAPQLDAERYRRMLRYFDTIGPSGARMMRQTASFQICVDGGESPAETWRVLNALAPYVVAIFASSPRYEGRDTGHRSFRRHVWGTLDPRRTGVLGRSPDPVGEYLVFALDAPAFLMPDVDGGAMPFRYWLERETATERDWLTHLSTLFPEVRPRGYFELRSADAVAPEWFAAPLVLVAGLVYHAPSRRAAAALLGEPDAALLARAGQCGLSDPAVRRTATALADLSLDGCVSLGRDVVASGHLATAADYFSRYTRRGRSPADD